MKSSRSMSVFPVGTRVFRQGENLVDFVVSQVGAELVQESMLLAITSKIVSLAENRVVDRSSITKERLIEREADHHLGDAGFGCILTVKHGHLIMSAGIDESNSETGGYILYPEDPFRSARDLWDGLRRQWNIKDLGVILTDSRTTPLRKGVTGFSLAHWGFQGLKNRIGAPDLFGREMKMTMVNLADTLAAAATLGMGETDESRPLAVLECGDVSFVDEGNPSEMHMPPEQDLYYPFFKRGRLTKA